MSVNRKILMIHTGGTIGMVRTPQGYAPQKAAFHALLDAMPELHSDAMPSWDIVDMEPLLDSSNITVVEWNAIGRMIAGHYDAYDGFVVLHGTDTMAYTASALSFMLRGNGKPVVLTGSQIPLCEIRNDARDNIITSLLVAASDKIHEVCLYFGGKLLRGNRAISPSSRPTTPPWRMWASPFGTTSRRCCRKAGEGLPSSRWRTCPSASSRCFPAYSSTSLIPS